MKLSRNVALSIEILGAHKLRSLLSISGIVVGVGAVVLVASMGRGAERRIVEQIRDMGTNLIVVNAGQTRVVAGRRRQMAVVTTLTPADADAIAGECPSVELAAPALNRKLATRRGSETTNTNVLGITADGLEVRNLSAAEGRFFTPEEDRASRRLAVVGPTVVRNLFDGSDPVGQVLRIGRVPFEVIGVSAPKGMDAGGSDQDDLVIVPLRTAMRRLMNVTHVETVFVRARGENSLSRAEEEIRELLRRRHRLRHGSDDFTIQNQVALIEAEREIVARMTTLVGSVAGLSLAVGGVGILAVMLISVRERRMEIGLRRALGARRRDIRRQFLIESALLAVTGGIAGALVGVVGSEAVSALGYQDAIVSWPAVGAGLVFSVTVGVVFGIHPAVRAARLEPVRALRAE